MKITEMRVVPFALGITAVCVLGVLFVAFLGSGFLLKSAVQFLWTQDVDITTTNSTLGQLLISTVAASIALLLAGQKFWEWYAAYVVCSLEVSSLDDRPVAELTLKNSSVFRRKVRWACLVVSPHGSNFLDLLRKHLRCNNDLSSTNDVVKLETKCTSDLQCAVRHGIVVVPLPFFYSEQLGIRDETITCSVPLNDDLPQGLYDVRFFVYPEESSIPRFGFHRCVHRVCHVGRGGGEWTVKLRAGSADSCR